MSSAGSPIIFLGFPRSGTTVTFEAFSRHPSLGWPSAYTAEYPTVSVVEGLRRLLDNSFVHLAGKKGQYGKTIVGNRFLPQPNEAYGFWDLHSGVDFSRGTLHGVRADRHAAERVREAVRRLLKWQGRPRFAAKLTGPPRITFLDSVFGDCLFVHVVRDGRAAVHSLLRTDFWRQKGGYDRPFWSGGLSAEREKTWEDSGRDPGVLAALQWTAILEATRLEASQLDARRFFELRYEDFVRSPHEMLRKIFDFCGLEDSAEVHAYLQRSAILADMNQKFRSDFSTPYIAKLTSLMQPVLAQLGYQE